MLKALELSGFKSFADRTRFEFPRGISVVVGPNGSGKSNVVDAVKWVLGSQSAKSLRGKEMTDVIFNGCAIARAARHRRSHAHARQQRRPAARSTPTKCTSRAASIAAAKANICINRQPCRLRDIRELLAGTGITTEAYCIIEQGKVDVLLQSSPRDRRVIFEEAAGISQFKAKKATAARRLERVEQNLLRLSDIVDEVESRLRSVRSQAGKARRYRECTDAAATAAHASRPRRLAGADRSRSPPARRSWPSSSAGTPNTRPRLAKLEAERAWSSSWNRKPATAARAKSKPQASATREQIAALEAGVEIASGPPGRPASRRSRASAGSSWP